MHRNAEQRFQATIAFFSTQFLQIVHNTSVIQFLRSMPAQSRSLLPDFYRKTFNSIRICVVSLSSFPMKSELFKISKKKKCRAQGQTTNQFALPDRWPAERTNTSKIHIDSDRFVVIVVYFGFYGLVLCAWSSSPPTHTKDNRQAIFHSDFTRSFIDVRPALERAHSSVEMSSPTTTK